MTTPRQNGPNPIIDGLRNAPVLRHAAGRTEDRRDDAERARVKIFRVHSFLSSYKWRLDLPVPRLISHG
jgi:hypothetical protein